MLLHADADAGALRHAGVGAMLPQFGEAQALALAQVLAQGAMAQALNQQIMPASKSKVTEVGLVLKSVETDALSA